MVLLLLLLSLQLSSYSLFMHTTFQLTSISSISSTTTATALVLPLFISAFLDLILSPDLSLAVGCGGDRGHNQHHQHHRTFIFTSPLCPRHASYLHDGTTAAI